LYQIERRNLKKYDSFSEDVFGSGNVGMSLYFMPKIRDEQKYYCFSGDGFVNENVGTK